MVVQQFLSSNQGARTGQGKEVVASFRLNSKNLGVETSFKSYPVNQGVIASFQLKHKIEVFVIRGLLLPSSYFWETILKRLPWISPQDLGFHVKILCTVLLFFLCDDDDMPMITLVMMI